jgi:hypothetical protein
VIVQQMVEESCKLCYQLDFQCFPEKCNQILLVSGFNFILATELRTITLPHQKSIPNGIVASPNGKGDQSPK